MRRITVDEVRAACEATGYRLARGVTLRPEMKCGCPLGVLAIHERKADRLTGHPTKMLGIGHSYCAGVMNGFDDCNPTAMGFPDYDDGHADGTAIRLALLPAAQ